MLSDKIDPSSTRVETSSWLAGRQVSQEGTDRQGGGEGAGAGAGAVEAATSKAVKQGADGVVDWAAFVARQMLTFSA